MFKRKMRSLSIILLAAVTLSACTFGPGSAGSTDSSDASVSASVKEPKKPDTKISASTDSTDTSASDYEVIDIDEAEYVEFGDGYKLYNVNSGLMYTDNIDFNNDETQRFPAFVIAKTDADGKGRIVKKTIQKAYDKETFLKHADYLIDFYDMDKLYDTYLESRKSYIEQGYEEIDIADAILEVTGNDAVEFDSIMINALFEYMTLPGATTKGADFIMPMPYYPAMQIAITDLGKDGYGEMLIRQYDHVDIVVDKDNWNDANILSGISYLNPDEGILWDATDEFEMRYYKLDKTDCTLFDSVTYDGYHEEPDSEDIFYVLTNDDGTETYLPREEAHKPQYDVEPVKDLDYKWFDMTPLNIVRLCEHFD